MPTTAMDLAGRPLYLAIIPFIASDDDEARECARSYAEDLLISHGEVDSFAAMLQRPGHDPEPLYCGHADEQDICVEAPGHVPAHAPRLTLVRPA